MHKKMIIQTMGALLSVLLVLVTVFSLRGTAKKNPAELLPETEALTAAKQVKSENAAPGPEVSAMQKKKQQNEENTSTTTVTENVGKDETTRQSLSTGETGTDAQMKFLAQDAGLGTIRHTEPTTLPPYVIPEETTAETTTKPETTTEPTSLYGDNGTFSGGITTTTQPSTALPTTTVPQTTELTKPAQGTPTLETNLEKEKAIPMPADGKFTFTAYINNNSDYGYTLKIRVNGKEIPRKGLSTEYTVDVKYGDNTIEIYMLNGSTIVTQNVYHYRVETIIADETNPNVGKNPPTITVNHLQENKRYETSNTKFELYVQTNAPHLNVKMNNAEQISSDRQYTLAFQRPTNGDWKDYKVEIVAWDDAGNSAYKSYTIRYIPVGEEEKTGKVRVILDAATVGLPMLDEDEMDIQSGDTVADVLEKFLEEHGYSYEFGNEKSSRYLSRIERGDLCYDNEIPQALKDLLLSDKIDIQENENPDTLGEKDYTLKSGWMCIVNEDFIGKGMGMYSLQPGDEVRICFTLSEGKDVGGAKMTSDGKSGNYCTIWRDGEPVISHRYVNNECEVCHKKKEDAA